MDARGEDDRPGPGEEIASAGRPAAKQTEKDDITKLLVSWSGGDDLALGELMDRVYGRLSRLANSYLRQERREHTLEASGLVHEAFLRLIHQDKIRWRDRAHFFAIAAKMMRRVLVDHARRHESLKRGGAVVKVPLQELVGTTTHRHPDLIALDDALKELESKDGELAELVVMRYFGGMKQDEIAAVKGVSEATLARRWRTVRAWLFEYLNADSS